MWPNGFKAVAKHFSQLYEPLHGVQYQGEFCGVHSYVCLYRKCLFCNNFENIVQNFKPTIEWSSAAKTKYFYLILP